MDKIYGLIDPRTKEIRYIGKTKFDLNFRLSQHINDAKSIMEGYGRRKINKKFSWIISLFKKDLSPTMILLEIVSVNDSWIDRERYWIALYKQRYRLTNMTSGGEGSDANKGRKFGTPPKERKELISRRTKEAMKNLSPEKKER